MQFKFDKILGIEREKDITPIEPELEIEADCSSSELVGEPVYVSGDNEVRKASASDISTAISGLKGYGF